MYFGDSLCRWWALTSLCLAPFIAHAGNIAWTNPRVELVAQIDQERAGAAFHFKNTGTQKIAIVDVRTSCGCTTATLDKRVYEPGEEGDIQAVFNLVGRSGAQENVIQVLSDDSPDQPMNLVLAVTIPDAFVIEPRLLIWKKSDAAGEAPEQFATLSAAGQLKLSVRAVKSDNPDFEAKLVTEEEGRRFKIVVKPKLPGKEGRATVRIQLEGPPGHPRTTSVYGVVK